MFCSSAYQPTKADVAALWTQSRMFPLRCVVEAAAPGACCACSEGGAGVVLIDSYAIVTGDTKMSQLCDTVLGALGLAHLADDAKGKICVKNWKPLRFDQIADEDTTVDVLLKDLSNNVTLTIITKPLDVCNGEPSKAYMNDMKDQLLKAILCQNPGFLNSISDPDIKSLVEQICRGDSSEMEPSCVSRLTAWCQRQIRRPSLANTAAAAAAAHSAASSTKFNQFLEIPKLERWMSESPNPTRSKLLQYMHVLNSTNFRKHNSKITYQQICNWFSNARATQRKQLGVLPKVYNNNVRNLSLDFNDFIRQNQQQAVAGLANHKGDSASDTDDVAEIPISASLSSSPDSGGNGLDVLSVSMHEEPTTSTLPQHCQVSGNSITITVKQEDAHSDDSSPPANGDAAAFAEDGSPTPPSSYPVLLGAGASGHRSRLMFDPLTEVPMLERWFDENPHPSWLQIDTFTETLNSLPYRQSYPPVTTYNVKIWFKNRRAKNKRMTISQIKNETCEHGQLTSACKYCS